MIKELFTLLKLGLENISPQDDSCKCLLFLKPEQWTSLISMAEEQGVSAIVFDGYQKFFDLHPDSSSLDIDSLMDWLGQTSYLEQQNDHQLEILKEFCGALVRDACTVMVMKGQANALYYPNPKHRATGDIDIYMFDTYQKGNELAAKYGAIVDTRWYKHSQIHFKDEMFENHLYFVTTREGKHSKELNASLVNLLYESERKVFENTDIRVPNTMFNALFLTYHSLSHFVSEGLHLKQVLDWSVFLKAEQNDIDWKKLYSLCDRYHLRRFLDVMNDIAINYLGVKQTCADIQVSTRFTEKVLHSIIYDKDFVFGSGEGSWHNRIHLIKNLFKYRWKYEEIYQYSIWRQIYLYASGYLFHTE